MYLDTGIGIAGGQRSLIELLRHIDRARFHPLVYAPGRSGTFEACGRLGVDRVPLPFESVHLSSRHSSRASSSLLAGIGDLFASAYGLLFLVREMVGRRIDIVHANTFKAALIGGLASVLAGRPMIFHDRILLGHGVLGGLVARMSRIIIAVSGAVGSKYSGAPAGKVRIVNDSVDPDRLAPRGEPPPERRVCFLGRVSEEKGIDMLVEAASLIGESVPDARFVIGGSPFTAADGAYAAQVRNRLEALGLAGSFEFTGYVEDTAAFLAGASVLVLPSRREAFGIVLLEAMAAGRPVVAFDTGGTGEIVSHGEDGLLVEAGDIEGLARAVISILEDEETARRMGRRGREKVVREFSSRSFAAKVMDIYLDVRTDVLAGAKAAG
jgi:glycosyltransferase involved in cell wall biosynthesis